MIGLSVSRCVAAIARGEVEIEEVEKIVGSTTVPHQIAWALVARRYCDHEWKDFPDQATDILLRLLREGKIEQPRITAGRRPVIVNDQIWVGSESEIQWDPLN